MSRRWALGDDGGGAVKGLWILLKILPVLSDQDL